MRVFHWLFLLLVLSGIVLVAILCSDMPEGAAGILHPQYDTMLKGGPSIAASEGVKWLGLFFGIGIMLFFVMGIFIGMNSRKRHVKSAARGSFLIGASVYVFALILLTVAYWSYHDSGSSSYFGGFPLPTAVLLYGVTIVPIIFTILYVRHFNRWVLTSEELDSFQEICSQRNARLDKAESHQ